MARRRTRRRKRSYEQASQGDGSEALLVMEELSPRARRLVENGVIDLGVIAGSGPGGKITSGDILHAARVMEVEQSVARIETTYERPAPQENFERPAPQEVAATEPDEDESPTGTDPPKPPGAVDSWRDRLESDEVEERAESSTSTAVNIGGEPIAPEPDPWDEYHSSTEGFSERARVGADQSWGEAEAHLAAMAEAVAEQLGPQPSSQSDEPAYGDEPAPVRNDETAAESEAVALDVAPVEPDVSAGVDTAAPLLPIAGDEARVEVVAEQVAPNEPAAVEAIAARDDAAKSDAEPLVQSSQDRSNELWEAPASISDQPSEAAPQQLAQPEPATEVMMDFGTLELVDPDSVWAEGAEDFAPWFLAHSRQLGDVLGLEAGLNDARQFTTKSATGVLGRDDNGEDVVVVSSQNAIADDSDLGRALGMAASSGAASVALVSAALHDDQLKALAWLNNQTKSGVKWYGIEMRVVRIADSPAAMLFELVASPPQQAG